MRTDVGPITLRSISVSDMDNNVYLLTHRHTGEQILIDAAADEAAISSLIREGVGDVDEPADAVLRWIITTHSHWDHVRALGWLAAHVPGGTIAGALDAPAIDVPTDRPVEHGDVIEVDGFSLEVIHLRGHTPGSIALVLAVPGAAHRIFTGDSLFPGGVGKTNSPQDFTSLIDDVTQRLFDRFDDDTVSGGTADGSGARRGGCHTGHLNAWNPPAPIG